MRIVEDSLYLTTLAIVGFLAILYGLKELILVVSGSEQNSREILIFNLAYASSSTMIACLVGLLFADYHIVLVGLGIGYAIPILGSLVIKIRQYGFVPPEQSALRKSIIFGGPSIFVGTVKALVPFFTSLIVGMWIDLQAVATLSIALLLATIFSFVVNPPQTAYQAYIVNAFETGNYNKGNEMARLVIELFMFLSIPVAFLLVTFSPLLILLLSTVQYIDATVLIPFTVAYAVLIAFSYFWKIQLDLVEKPHLTGIAYAISAFILAGTSVLLVPVIGLIGVGIAMVVQAGFIVIALYTLGNNALPIPQRWRSWLTWFLASIILIALFEVLISWGIPTILSALVSLAAYLAVSFVGGLINIQRAKSILYLLFSREKQSKASTIGSTELATEDNSFS
jgi:O-antigen/teichoic acid export membrane protein